MRRSSSVSKNYWRRCFPSLPQMNMSSRVGIHHLRSGASNVPLLKKKKKMHGAKQFSDGGEGANWQHANITGCSSSSQNANQNDSFLDSIDAQEVTGLYLKDFPIDLPESGVVNTLFERGDKTPIFFFKLLIDDIVVNNIVTETSRFAAQKKESTVLIFGWHYFVLQNLQTIGQKTNYM
nr:unnamed protein product [Callosobruchus analis]